MSVASASRVRSRGGLTWVELAVVLLILGVLIALLLPAIAQPNSRRRSPCKSNLKQIGLALHNYHDTYGCFPPAITYGPDGKPWHSWRVLLLPWLEANDWYRRYRFDEPWDGPNNRKLAVESSPFLLFHCPTDEDSSPETTSYLAVVGERTMWPPDGAATLSDATDGTARTIHVVEVSNSGVHWMEPADLRLDAMQFGIGPKKQPGIRSGHGGTDHWIGEDDPWVANVEFVEGTVRTLGEETSPERVRSLLVRDDGQPAEF